MKVSSYQSLDKRKKQERILLYVRSNGMTFFEKQNIPSYLTAIIWGLPITIIQIIVASLLNENPFKDFSFFIGIMGMIIMFLVIWATKKLRIFLVKIYSVTNLSVEEYINNYCNKFTRLYHKWKLVPWGIFFGFLNLFMGLTFGIWYNQLTLIIILCIQFFYIGFIAGMAIGGVYTIVAIVIHLSHELKLNLNFIDTDRCGGTLEIGKILFTFSITVFIAALTIGSYIFFSPWENNDSFIVKLLIYFWISFPFIISILVFVLPVLNLRTILKAYKENEALKIRKRISVLHIKLFKIDTKYSEEAQKEVAFLQDHLNQLLKFEEIVNKMNTFPYSLNLKLTYALTVITSILYLVEFFKESF